MKFKKKNIGFLTRWGYMDFNRTNFSIENTSLGEKKEEGNENTFILSNDTIFAYLTVSSNSLAVTK